MDEEEFDGDESGLSGDMNKGIEEDEFVLSEYEREVKFFDRSFKNVYVGYADGIDLNHLDNTVNSQFARN